MIYFIGAGSGDPELLTIKGKKLIDSADIIVYAGSLVNKEIFSDSSAQLFNSAEMTLEEVIEVLEDAEKKDLKAVRVHTGDPSIYGAIREQIDILESKGIECKVVPGVSSFLSACATLKREYTLPEISQTVILTRLEGRTPVPEREKLENLAVHRASMAIFLSVSMIEEVVKRLATSYPLATPVAVVSRASWSDEKVIRGTLMDIAEKTLTENITKTALILVGDFLGDEYALSKLYDKHFTHEYRKGTEE